MRIARPDIANMSPKELMEWRWNALCNEVFGVSPMMRDERLFGLGVSILDIPVPQYDFPVTSSGEIK